jgi:hypothetical protein
MQPDTNLVKNKLATVAGATGTQHKQAVHFAAGGNYTVEIAVTKGGNGFIACADFIVAQGSPASTVVPAVGLMMLAAAALMMSGCQAGNQLISFYTSTSTYITQFNMVMSVPPLPTENAGTLFIWPGLEPLGGSTNFNPLNLGVLQPVLSYGPSCAPNQPSSVSSAPYASWFISAQYVNTNGNVAGHTGCNGGDVMTVSPGDFLTVNMTLSGTTWTQTISSYKNSKTVSYSIDLQGQNQNWAMFDFENYGDFTPSPAWNLYFIHIETAQNDPTLCTSAQIQYPTDGRASCSGIVVSGNACDINSCTYKAGYPLPKDASVTTMFKANALKLSDIQ